MEDGTPWGTIILFFSFILLAFCKGEKTSHRDEEINDYWSDGSDIRPRVCSPTAEATDLKSVKCGFESRHTQIAQFKPNNLNKQKVRIERDRLK